MFDEFVTVVIMDHFNWVSVPHSLLLLPSSHPSSLLLLPSSLPLTLQVCEGHWKCWDCKLFDWSSEQPVHPTVPDWSSHAPATHYLQPTCSSLQCSSLHQPPSLCRGPETQNPPSLSLHTPRNPRYSTTSYAATFIHTVYRFQPSCTKVIALPFSCPPSIASFPGGTPGNEANPSTADEAWYWLKLDFA